MFLRRAKETTIEQRVVDEAKRRWRLRSMKLKLEHDAGWPDRLFLIPGGKPFFIEFKRETEPLSILQMTRIEYLEILGYDVEVHDSYVSAIAALARRIENGLH